MAERRMFSKAVIDSDAFLDLPLSTQALYFHLSMRADDDGFVNNPKKIQRMIGASDDDCKLLLLKQFIISFESGIIVIRHWRLHNYIQKDRYKQTLYQAEKNQLQLQENGMYTECIQNVSKLDTQVSIGKDNIDKIRDNNITNETAERRSVNPEIEDFFETLWKMLKSNANDRKSKVSAKRKKELFNMGDRAVKAIEVYLQTQEEQYMHRRDRFLNEIIDNYLDKTVSDFQKSDNRHPNPDDYDIKYLLE